MFASHNNEDDQNAFTCLAKESQDPNEGDNTQDVCYFLADYWEVTNQDKEESLFDQSIVV